MFPLDQQDIDHIAPDCWQRITSLVGIALHILGLEDTPLPRGLVAKALLVLKPAEAMARRLLYLMAPDLTVSSVKARASGRPVPVALDPGARQYGQATRFRFSEPLGHAPKNNGPRIRFFNEPLRPPKPAPQLPTSAPLLARIRALQAVIDNPEAHATRRPLACPSPRQGPSAARLARIPESAGPCPQMSAAGSEGRSRLPQRGSVLQGQRPAGLGVSVPHHICRSCARPATCAVRAACAGSRNTPPERQGPSRRGQVPN